MTSVERQVRTLMRAWPIPDRVERGNEIVGTTLDLVPDGRNRLPLALAINLVIGGLRGRWRMRPPLWRWFYHRLGGRLPPRYHRWMLNDLSGSGWQRRMVTFRTTAIWATMLIGYALSDIIIHTPGGRGLLYPSSFFLTFLFLFPLALLANWGPGTGTIGLDDHQTA